MRIRRVLGRSATSAPVMPAVEPEGALLVGGGVGSSWQAVATAMTQSRRATAAGFYIGDLPLLPPPLFVLSDLSFTSVKKCEGERDRKGDMAVYFAGPLRRRAAPSARTPGRENEWKSEDGERPGGSPIVVGRTTGDWGDGTEGRAASLLHIASGLHHDEGAPPGAK